MRQCDLLVIGSGPAGRRAAVQAAKLGKSVLVVDNRAQVGGVSVHTGTIPSKTLRGLHGGAAGVVAPRGNSNAWKHGRYSRAALVQERDLRDVLRRITEFPK